ncbi:flagellar motor switch phosphatase FliY [Candidatus Desulforudis audaxviator]|uniref:flagellar motor switch phosphatase FliY n=1 Tax=Candidatus Desulforudis audaxviator TaxID=471827 RepID=UPI001FAE2780|nr:flagellar motor switch phosphatase FliY [Candidatus Desulforudis audaxviator]
MTGLLDKILDQEEIDALLKAGGAKAPGEREGVRKDPAGELTDVEKDTLGEIGNICMGSAATTLSALLGQKVSITSPVVTVKPREELLKQFTVPYLAIEVKFTAGLEGSVLLVIEVKDAAVVADLMMGNDGKNPPPELGEMEISAASEAMNQMIGTSATALAQLVGRTVSISPPRARVLQINADAEKVVGEFEAVMVVVSFNMQVGDLIDTSIFQIMTVDTARNEADLLLRGLDTSAEPAAAAEPKPEPAAPPRQPAGQTATVYQVPYPKTTPAPDPAPAPAWSQEAPGTAPDAGAGFSELALEKLDLILDLPLKVTVILGRSKRPIKDVLGLTPGSIMELSNLADEPVEILVNGALVAWGEVVVVNDNFGVRITSIISPRDRIQNLRNTPPRSQPFK